MVNLKPITDWSNKDLRCHFCDATKSVKYETAVINPAIDVRTEISARKERE